MLALARLALRIIEVTHTHHELGSTYVERLEKIDQIEAIDDEVGVLHPLLHKVLSQLSGVTYVEYTHGPDEMGADFVLERTDAAIGETYYIGIVAKCEKILQNFSEIERQIDECRVSRKIRQGTQEIRLQEVWVITTKTFSRNAKIKIQEKFSSQKLHFFDQQWLVDQVDRHNSYYWHQLPNATGSYLATLTSTLDKLDAQTTLLHAGATKYIELDIEAVSTDGYKKKSGDPRRLVNLKEEVLSGKVSVVEADMGFGKSRLARQLARELAIATEFKRTNVLPVFQPFVLFAEQDAQDIDDSIKAIIGAPCFDEVRSAGGTFILILDGIDEVNGDTETRESLLSHLLDEVRRVNHVKLLLTTRPFKLLHEIPEFSRTAKRYSIRPLSLKKLIAFIQDICGQLDLPKNLYQDLAKSELFKQLPQNPIAAALLTNLLSQKKQELPSNITELYSKSMEFMLGRWDERRALSTEQLFTACERLSRELARYMLDNRLVYISRSEVHAMFQQFISERNMTVSVTDAYSYLTERSTIFGALDEATLFFRHRSFAEYLYALDAYEKRNLSTDENAFHPYWTNVYFFYMGLLVECPEILQHLASLSLNNEREQWVRFLQFPKYLLAAHQTPYAITEGALQCLVVDIAKLYLNVKSGRTESKLNELPEMKLLWLFSAITKHVLGYEYFRKALPLVIALLDDDVGIDIQVKHYALFFAGAALAELGDKCGYVLLAKSYRPEDLPLPISLALTCEAEIGGRLFQRDPLIKLHEKRLKKLLYADKNERIFTQKRLDALFETPLKTLK